MATDRVVLLHGIWMVGATMQWFAAKLKAEGFAPETFGYHSVVGGPDAAAPQLAGQLRDGGPAHIVAHSLGGLIALQTLATHPDLPVERMVCLGVPLCGSAAAAGLAHVPVAGLMLGRSAPLLQEGCAVWPERFEVGMVAGRLPHGLGAFFAHFEDEHDGTVSVAETRSEALADHVVVEAGHSGLLFSADAARHAAEFLRDGRFRR